MTEQKYKYMQQDDAGRSMIEIVGVLAIMGLMTAGAMVLVRSGSASNKRARASDEVMAIVENIRGLYAGEDGFSQMPTTEAEGTQLIDALYLNTVTPLGPDTKYSVKGVGEKEYFEVFLRGLDDDDCRVLAMKTWPDAFNVSCDGAGTLYLTFGR